MTGCLADHTLIQFVEGHLLREAAEAAWAHIDQCPGCMGLLVELGRSVDAAASRSTPPDSAAAAFTPPEHIEEYRLVRPLGQGAMGQVHLAHDTRLDRPVAIKFIAAHQPDDAARERFLVEARAIARLQHPNVVGIYRVGILDAHPYLVSELVPGLSLDRLPRPIPWERALRIGVGLSRGLGAAHRHGVLHRDIKPANVMLTQGDEVKLLDFGLAKLLDVLPLPAPAAAEAGAAAALADTASAPAGLARIGQRAPVSPALTHSGTLLGTPLYMAPEVFCGAPAARTADVYSTGALLYELCGGRVPHLAGSIRSLSRLIQAQEPPSLLGLVPGMDPELAGVIERCLRRDPTARFPSGVELAAALEQIELRLSSTRSGGGPQRPWGRIAAVTGACLLLGGLGLLLRPWERPAWHRSEMVLLGGGEFTMGSTPEEVATAYEWSQRQGCTRCKRSLYEREQPARQVRLSPFYLDSTEVTNADFAAWLNRLPGVSVENRQVRAGGVLLADLYAHYGPGGLRHLDGRFVVGRGDERMPVVQVTWDAAQRYCQAQGKRLPTEAEWEFAAHGTSRRGDRFPWGADMPRCDGVVFGRAGRDDPEAATCTGLANAPAPVGSAAQDRTPEGISDLGGNVAEWVQDRFRERYPDCGPVCQDPVVVDGSDLRVQRGGAWYRGAEACRAAERARQQHDRMAGDVGFRCARAKNR